MIIAVIMNDGNSRTAHFPLDIHVEGCMLIPSWYGERQWKGGNGMIVLVSPTGRRERLRFVGRHGFE
jgi:hypothetical protein